MANKNCPEYIAAKKKADEIGGVVTWWVSFSVTKAEEVSYLERCGSSLLYISKKAQQYFKKQANLRGHA